MSALLHSGVTFTSSSFGVECLQPSIEVPGGLCISSSSINSSSVVKVSSGTCDKSIHISYSGATMFDRDSLASHSSQHVGRHSSSVSLHKGSHHIFFCSSGSQGYDIAAFKPLVAQTCFIDKGSLPQSLMWWQGQLNCLQQKSTSSVRKNG